MNHPTPKRLLAALTAGLLLTACTSSTDIPKTIETPMLTDVSQLESPMTPYYETREERALIWKGVRRYQEQCAQRFGVTLPPEEVDPDEEPPVGPDLQRRYPNFSKERIEELVDSYTSDSGPDPDKVNFVPTPESELRDEVMSGKTLDESRSTLKDSNGNPLPENGCGTEGWERVWGDVPRDYSFLPEDLMGDAYNLMLADPRYIEAEKDWSNCMRKFGYEFEHPHEAGESVPEGDVEAVRDMAEKNTGCVIEVNLAGRAMAIDIEYQYKLIKENEAQLREVLEKRKEVLNNAKEAFK